MHFEEKTLPLNVRIINRRLGHSETDEFEKQYVLLYGGGELFVQYKASHSRSDKFNI